MLFSPSLLSIDVMIPTCSAFFELSKKKIIDPNKYCYAFFIFYAPII